MSGKERVFEGKIIPKRDKFNETVASGSPKRKRDSNEDKFCDNPESLNLLKFVKLSYVYETFF